MKYKFEIKHLIFAFVFFLIMVSCKRDHTVSAVKDDNLLLNIKKRGKIIATTNYNSVDYFIYKGLPMGFQLDLLKAFSKHIGVKLEFIITNDLASNMSLLALGKCDIIAHNITITRNRKTLVNFSSPITQTRQVLVQRNPYKLQDACIKKTLLIRNILNLSGKTVHVQKNSVHYDRLINIQNEIGDSIHIVVVDTMETEQLMELVANGTIDYTIADENFAQVNKSYYKNLDVQTPVSFQQNLAWAVRKESDSLLVTLNNWIREYKQTKEFQNIYDTYFRNPRSVKIVQSEFYSIKGGKISRYDKEIKLHSKLIGWDWRLLASLIYQESQFHPELTGWSGAFGIMQMMPQTARKFGVTSKSPVSAQIKAGVRLKMAIDNFLPKEIINPEERIKFILASYNAGVYHVIDARNLARKYGKDPNTWTDNVDHYMKLKSRPKYYNDPVVKYGYSRGYETYQFVVEVLDRYNHYKNIVK
jgi:membrane-bound lytic murein transglycosylase F